MRRKEQVASRDGLGSTRLCITILIAITVGAGCSSAPKRSESGGSGGGYYLDDGPGSNPPRNLDSIPDAVPKAEPVNRAASRPYSVFGREYVPMSSLAPYKARGVASWYGRRYHGRRTSIGEIYDMYAMSAAHPTLPLPSYVRVTNLQNGRSVIVRVNDRGPFLSNRLIDLSYAAAYRLDYIGRGSATVEVELLVPGQAVTAAPPPQAVSDAAQSEPAAPEAPIPTTIDATGIFLQIGAFASRENADLFRDQVARQLPWIAGALRIESRDGLHRVRAGPYRDRVEALAVSGHIRAALEVTPVVVR